MSMNRREFLQVLAVAAAGGMSLQSELALAEKGAAKIYDLPKFGNVNLLHITDCHAQLLPIYFREPNVNLGFGDQFGKVPHLVGEAFLKHFGFKANTIDAHAFTYLNFDKAAETYGKVGGFAHLATLVKRMKATRPGALLLDGGDTWQGSGTALWSNAQDMVDACKALGVDVMTLHWEVDLRRSAGQGNRGKGFRRQDRHRCPERQNQRFRRCGVQAVRHEEHERRAGGDHRPGLPLHADRQPALAGPELELTASRKRTCRRPSTRRGARAPRSWSCCRTTAWTSISRWPAACAASTRSWAAIPMTACRPRWWSRMPVARRW